MLVICMFPETNSMQIQILDNGDVRSVEDIPFLPNCNAVDKTLFVNHKAEPRNNWVAYDLFFDEEEKVFYINGEKQTEVYFKLADDFKEVEKCCYCENGMMNHMECFIKEEDEG